MGHFNVKYSKINNLYFIKYKYNKLNVIFDFFFLNNSSKNVLKFVLGTTSGVFSGVGGVVSTTPSRKKVPKS